MDRNLSQVINRIWGWYRTPTGFAALLLGVSGPVLLLLDWIEAAGFFFAIWAGVAIPYFLTHFEISRTTLTSRLQLVEVELKRQATADLAKQRSIRPERGRLEAQLEIIDHELDVALRGSSEWNRNRIPALRSSFIRLCRTQLVPSASTSGPILEIGSDGQLSSAKVLCRLLDRPVIATNFMAERFAPKIGNYPISLREANPERLDFNDNYFSLIFGRAVLEHISDITSIFRECWRVMQPGAALFLEGGPFWTTPRGHHMSIQCPSGVKYGFDTMPDLIPSWLHLEVDAQGLQSFLVEKKEVPVEDAQLIADYIYDSDDQNRTKPSEIMDIATSIGFSQVRFECSMVDSLPSEELLGRYGIFDLTCQALSVIAVK